jgi:hypothetical protein
MELGKIILSEVRQMPCEATFVSNKLKKVIFFILSFYFYKTGEPGEQNKSYPGVRAHTNVKEEVSGKGDRRVNTVQKCVHLYVNAKMKTVVTIP